MVGWGAGCIYDIRVVGCEVEMDGDMFGVSIKSVWQDCVCPLVEV